MPDAVTGSGGLQVLPVVGLPEVEPGADVGRLVVRCLEDAGTPLQDGDIVVVTSKIVSKAERLVATVHDPSERADLVLRESHRVVSERATGTGITRVVAAHAGPVMAGAGIDASNTGDAELLLLPHDPDASARRVHDQLLAAVPHALRIGVLLSDTAGRPWRAGLVDLALGVSGVLPTDDLRGRYDAEGRPLAVTVRCLADEIAAAADLVKGKTERIPVAVVRGLPDLVVADGPGARSLVRSDAEDWFSLGRAEAVRDALGVAPGSAESLNIGIESVLPETLTQRVDRALQTALLGCNAVEAAHTADDASTVRLRATDPVELGRAWARFEVALAGERLQCSGSHDETTVAVHIADPRG
ncbi:coenzyme F420-0:L-glutamate ligase [Luteipulveratus sp. YIM 133132]|uniref:coenzyme F420-0:L-glutamate ligase n=1 Tax=Luteipulveratus flavus TaxID=3031728 RepID=UPI0023B1CD00|nr:coenzyme F420-0:L-glutamate ligase [Luteipulveratus sp. YIM 133132]MDE9367704.1 coenzyme F420-0:L-glutamate ligase [Luteipulveratus sp. YIM 133132]